MIKFLAAETSSTTTFFFEGDFPLLFPCVSLTEDPIASPFSSFSMVSLLLVREDDVKLDEDLELSLSLLSSSSFYSSITCHLGLSPGFALTSSFSGGGGGSLDLSTTVLNLLNMRLLVFLFGSSSTAFNGWLV